MKVRSHGLLVLALVAVVPTAVFGVMAVGRSERTAVAEVRVGNARTADSIAHNLETYARAEQMLLETVAADALQVGQNDAELLLTAFALRHQHVHDLTVITTDGALHAGSSSRVELARSGLESPATTPPTPTRADSLAHSINIARPVIVAGKTLGAVAARVDLVGVWAPVNAVRIGETGFVRLVSPDGKLLAHGNPDERRQVFIDDPQANLELVQGARAGRLVTNQQGDQLIASVAGVPTLGATVVVEQTVQEAFAMTRAMKRDLFLLLAVAAAVAVAVGLFSGGGLVRALEQLRDHTRVLARGELSARTRLKTRIVEVKALGTALDDMSSSLEQLEEQSRVRERMTTFGRVAAGLAHDLRQPVEAIRMAVEEGLRAPKDAPELLASAASDDVPRLVRFVDDMRRLAQTGDVALTSERFSPLRVARDVARSLSRAQRYRGVEFRVEGDTGEIVGDAELIHRALTNLAENGADACVAAGTAEAGVIIGIRDVGDDVHISVVDRGVGIEPDRLPQILGSDFKSTKRSNGVGLGLGVARHVAESHSGRIQLESKLGVGTTVDLILPREGPRHGPETGQQPETSRT